MADDRGWLLLIHQIPPKPNYFRVKVWRRLQRMGAVALKNSVYILPRSDGSQEDFHWVLRQIVQEGGDATLCEARFIEGMDDDQVKALFQAARDADYAQIAQELRSLRASDAQAELLRIKRRVAEVMAIDFFGAAGRQTVEQLVRGVEDRLAEPKRAAGRSPRDEYRGRTWVTRKGIHVDRIASAWLIRRFIDPDARFRFVDGKTYKHKAGELRFDMFEGEFTHQGDHCSFEVIVDRMTIEDAAVRAIAEIVHDLDLDDERFARPATAGIGRLLAGIAASHKDDSVRLERGSAMLDDLYESFKRKPA